jgi:CBS domain containing-hemolysin-like protein
MSEDIVWRGLSVLVLIALNAFFVTAEFSLVSVRRSRISQLVASGDTAAQSVQTLQRSIDRLLSTTQLGITLSSLALGWIGENTLAVFINSLIYLLPLGSEQIKLLSHTIALPLAFLLLAYFHLVLGELCPKTIALIYAEPLARFLAAPTSVISQIFKPFIWILNLSTELLLALVGVRYRDMQTSHRVTSEELQLMISTEGESSGLEASERVLLKNIFSLGEVSAGEIMVPRKRLVSLAEDVTFVELLEAVAMSGYSRYPVEGESLDDIRGILDFKDLALLLAQGQITLATPLKPWLKPIEFYPESTSLGELLGVMQRSHLKMVIIVDEFGGTAGLITLQDIIQEVLGYGDTIGCTESVEFQMLDPQTFLVQAQIDLEDLNELLELDLPVIEDYQTLGGFLLYQWQKIPEQGETLYYNNLQFTIVSVVGPRLEQISIHLPDVV